MLRTLVGILFGIVLFVLLALGISGLTELSRGMSATAEMSNQIEIDKKVVESKLIEWVYEHSGHISRATATEIVSYSLKTKSPLLMISLTAVESEFKPTAVSKAGAIGLTQVMFKHHKDMLIKANIIKERRDLFNVKNSIQAGDAIMNMYLKQSGGNVERALNRYLGAADGPYKRKIQSYVTDLYVLTQPETQGVDDEKGF